VYLVIRMTNSFVLHLGLGKGAKGQ
jgi:hypothetical protein